MFLHIGGDPVDNFHRNRRIQEIGCPNLDGRGTGQQEFNGIGSVHDATQPDHRNIHSLVNLPDHPECDRFDGGAR